MGNFRSPRFRKAQSPRPQDIPTAFRCRSPRTATRQETGIVWGSGAFSANANLQTVTGILRAFDATDLTKELWDSKLNAARDDVGNYAKFSPPTIVNGRVYLATFSNQLLVYGLFADFSVSASPGSATTSAGQSAMYTVTVRPTSSFSNPVSLSCSGLPAGAICSFNPTSVTPGTGAVTSTLTVTATAATGNSRPAFDFLKRPLSYAIWLPGLVLAGAGWMGSRNRKLARVLLCSALLGFILMLVRCGGRSSSGTPAGTYTVTITGASGVGVQHSTTVALIVN